MRFRLYQTVPVVLMISLTLGVGCGTALAQSRSKQASDSAKIQKVKESALDRLKTKALAETDRRVALLNKFLARLTNAKHLTTQDKSALALQVQEEINALTALRSKAEGVAEITALRAEVKSITQDYKAFATIFPKAALLHASDRVLVVADKMSSVSAKLEESIKKAESQGGDVEDMMEALAGIQNKIEKAKESALEAKKLGLELSSNKYPGNKSAMTTARKALQSARLTLVDARKDIKTILDELRKTQAGSSAATPSAAQR